VRRACEAVKEPLSLLNWGFLNRWSRNRLTISSYLS
jgi:hypothetical protein